MRFLDPQTLFVLLYVRVSPLHLLKLLVIIKSFLRQLINGCKSKVMGVILVLICQQVVPMMMEHQERVRQHGPIYTGGVIGNYPLLLRVMKCSIGCMEIQTMVNHLMLSEVIPLMKLILISYREHKTFLLFIENVCRASVIIHLQGRM